MATMVVEFEPSAHQTEFSGSSEEDSAYAKTFWQSVQLLPPMESRLVSSDIHQRLKRAPAGHQPVNVTYPAREEDPQKLKDFLEVAKMQQKAQEWKKFEKLSSLRQQDIALLEKHRQTRIDKEQISVAVRPARRDGDDQLLPMTTDSDDEHYDEDAATTLQQLDDFDQRIGQNNDCDSD